MVSEKELREALGIEDGVPLKKALDNTYEVPCDWCGEPIVKTRRWRRFCNAKCRKGFYNAAAVLRRGNGEHSEGGI